MIDTDTRDLVEDAREFLQGVLDRMEIAARVNVSEQDDKIVLDIKCKNIERIIGRRGQVIDALQHLVGKVTYRERAGMRSKPIVVDAGGYRLKHIERLESLAERMGRKAIKTQSIIELSPMTAHDRRVVHMALADVAGVTTRSEGEGEDRHVLVVPVEGDNAGDSVAME
ncbi:MAG: KH domain-containing protein [Proteobacteria bacterium]|nr:KH domain-containing protein [Pseudomonadota bacterium]